MSNPITDLEAAAAAAESSSVDPLVTVRNLVAAVRTVVADLKAAPDDAPKARKTK